MVVINGVKYACDRCIRGHRVSGCRHLYEPLKMIKRKGRPPTQCATCKRLRSKGASMPGQCKCGDGKKETSSRDAQQGVQTIDSDAQPLAQPAVQEQDLLSKQELSPQDLAKLRATPGVTIELPDGTVLGPHQDSRTPAYNSIPDYGLPEQSQLFYHPRISTAHGGAHYPPPQAYPMPEEDLLMTDKYRFQHLHPQQPQPYGRFPGPYNADLYNDSTGNNEAAAVKNARGDGYAPNTGTVAFQPRLAIDRELAASTQELADSLSGMPEVKPIQPRPSKVSENGAEQTGDVYAPEAHIPKLSNLY